MITTLLLADDDPENLLLVHDALEEASWAVDLREVEDGDRLIDYLKRHGRNEQREEAPRPGLILLDLKMPD